jgi:hypothetical protein
MARGFGEGAFGTGKFGGTALVVTPPGPYDIVAHDPVLTVLLGGIHHASQVSFGDLRAKTLIGGIR